jgi:hypothetical protein
MASNDLEMAGSSADLLHFTLNNWIRFCVVIFLFALLNTMESPRQLSPQRTASPEKERAKSPRRSVALSPRVIFKRKKKVPLKEIDEEEEAEMTRLLERLHYDVNDLQEREKDGWSFVVRDWHLLIKHPEYNIMTL